MSSQPPWSEIREQPRDVFDDVPEDGPRQGAHRPVGAAPRRTPAGLKAMVVVGSLGLLLGAAGYVHSTLSGEPRGLAAPEPPAATSSPAPSASAEPEDGQTAAETAAPEDAEQVGVFNATSLDGVAGAAGSELADLDWEIIATGNWGMPSADSVVYYAGDGVTGDTEEQAQRIAEAMGIEQTQADDAIAYPLVVVVGEDLGQEVLDRSGGRAPESGVAEAGPGQPGADPADPVLPEEQADAPVEDVPGAPAEDAAEQPLAPAPGADAVPQAPGEDAVPQVPGEQAPADQAGGL
ncbi:LytR C-terminal domain-containing protein [Kocuria palustris]|uniref:LytR C-terminal domain-containing protein n=1 Tax=Kocuria palustris TaxID=71999 RepID=UPI0016429831|nr:LytR C-terminal domain-containing protein [Kocuria palustris]